MNQDVTAPENLPGNLIGNLLSDETGELTLRGYAHAARDNLRLRELTALSRWGQPTQADVPPLHVLASAISSVLSVFNQTFATYPAPKILVNAVGFAALVSEAGGLGTQTTTNPIDRETTSTDSTVERFSRALAEWRGLLAPDHFDAMVRHIDRLLSDEEELEEDNVVPSLSSFDDMLAFLSGRPWVRTPAAGLNRRGQFSISWGKAHPQVDVTLTFLGEGSVKWYLYGLGKRRIGSAVGTSDRADLPTMLSRLGCDEWMAR